MLTIFLQINLRYFEERIGNERVSNILWCAGIVVATLLLKRPLSLLIAKLSAGIANRFSDRKNGKMFQDLTAKPLELLLQTFLYYIAINQLSVILNQVIFHRHQSGGLVEIRISDVVDKIFVLLLIVFFVLVISRIVDFIFHVLIQKAFATDDRDREQLFPLVKEVVKILIWVTGIFWVLGSVFSVNIPALITGLGIGGVAIALAAKESVENFFAAFTILTDKPFQTGDVIRLGNLEGEVERIGFRSTRLRNGDGALFIIPNKKLVNENLENLSKRDMRKVRLVFHLKYGISHSGLQQLLSAIQTSIQSLLPIQQPITLLTENFGETSFQLSVSYFLPEPLPDGLNAEVLKQQITLLVFQLIDNATAVPLSSIPAKPEATSTDKDVSPPQPDDAPPDES